MNLKKLKEALNKLPDDKLEKFYLTHGMSGTDDPQSELIVMFLDDEENHKELFALYDEKPMKEIVKFGKQVWEDAKKCIAGQMDESVFESYSEQDPRDDYIIAPCSECNKREDKTS